MFSPPFIQALYIDIWVLYMHLMKIKSGSVKMMYGMGVCVHCRQQQDLCYWPINYLPIILEGATHSACTIYHPLSNSCPQCDLLFQHCINTTYLPLVPHLPRKEMDYWERRNWARAQGCMLHPVRPWRSAFMISIIGERKIICEQVKGSRSFCPSPTIS